MLVVLRLALGWHFLYEGIWKVTHRDAFVAETEGFLSNARGPAAKLFYSLVPDIDGKERLEHDLALVEVRGSKGADGKPVKRPRLAARWNEMTDAFVAYYKPTGGFAFSVELLREFAASADNVCQRHVLGLDDFVKENGSKIKAHFESLQRFKDAARADPNTDFMRQRRWDEMQELRKEAKGWIADLDAREKALKLELMDLLKEVPSDKVAADSDAAKRKQGAAALGTVGNATNRFEAAKGSAQNAGSAKDATAPKSTAGPKPSDPPRDFSPAAASARAKQSSAGVGITSVASKSENSAKVASKESAVKATPADKETAVDFSPLAEGHDPAGPFRASRNPLDWPRIEQLSFLLTWGLLAIGACLMLGLFTRLSALAGAAFMLAVVFSQPSYPGVYPPDLPQMGHALLVNKDFVEMVALLVIASTKLGRWTGLDFVLHYCLVRPICRCCGCKCEEGE